MNPYVHLQVNLKCDVLIKIIMEPFKTYDELVEELEYLQDEYDYCIDILEGITFDIEGFKNVSKAIGKFFDKMNAIIMSIDDVDQDTRYINEGKFFHLKFRATKAIEIICNMVKNG